MTDTKNNQLQVIVEESGLEENKVQELLSHFGTDFKEAQELATKSRGINVTSEDQKKEMAEARTARLKLREVRIRVEKTRQELKEDSLRVGKAIDGAANIIKALIAPVEEHLEKQEKFAESLAKKRLQDRYAERVRLLSAFLSDLTVYNLETMADESFQALLDKSHAEHLAKQEAEKKAELERIEKQKKVDLYHKRKELLIPYWQFLKGDQPSIDFGEIPEDSFQIILKEVKEAKKQKDVADEKMRLENEKLKKEAEDRDKKTAEEREKRENLEKQMREREEEDRKQKQLVADQQAKEKAEQDELERKKLLAPDRDKLFALAEALKEVKMPVVQSKEAKKTLLDVAGMMGRLDGFIKQRAENL